MNTRTKIIEVDLDTLVPAVWNPKVEASDALIKKLARSVERDKSAGVLAVRELPDGALEVIDGNHRLEAIRSLGWRTAWVENFGRITTPEAVTICRRRNHEWVALDRDKYATLMREVVVPEIRVDDLVAFMPETRAELDRLLAFGARPEQGPGEGNGFRTVKLTVTEDVYKLWRLWIERVEHEIGAEAAPGTCFEYALADALSIARPDAKRETQTHPTRQSKTQTVTLKVEKTLSIDRGLTRARKRRPGPQRRPAQHQRRQSHRRTNRRTR